MGWFVESGCGRIKLINLRIVLSYVQVWTNSFVFFEMVSAMKV